MPIEGLDHINMRVRDVAASLAFFSEVLGMDVRPSPGGTDTVRGAWIYDGRGHPIVHLTDREIVFPSDAHHPFAATAGSGVIHHVALACQGYDAMLRAIADSGREHWEGSVPSIALRQIFVLEPNDILLELNFKGD